jgi:acetyltransferase-like isoleucine patch superfamily enzyme
VKEIIKKLIYKLVNFLLSIHQQYRDEAMYKRFNIPKNVRFWNLSLDGHIIIGDYTYFNDGCRIDSGAESKVSIGRHCAIGRYVHITSKTHDFSHPTTNDDQEPIKHIEQDTTIGDHVWIGDKAFINKGVQVGDYAIIGANAVVIRDVNPFEIVGGVPARHIRYNNEHAMYKKQIKLI